MRLRWVHIVLYDSLAKAPCRLYICLHALAGAKELKLYDILEVDPPLKSTLRIVVFGGMQNEM